MKNSIGNKGEFEIKSIPLNSNFELISIDGKESKGIKKITITKINDNSDLKIGDTIKLEIEDKKINKMVTDKVSKIEKDGDDYYIFTENSYVLRYNENKDNEYAEEEEKYDDIESLPIVGEISKFVDYILKLSGGVTAYIKTLFIKGRINNIDKTNSIENIFSNMSNDELNDFLEKLIEDRENLIKDLSEELGIEILIFNRMPFFDNNQKSILKSYIDNGSIIAINYSNNGDLDFWEKRNSNEIVGIKPGFLESKKANKILDTIFRTTEVIKKLKNKLSITGTV